MTKKIVIVESPAKAKTINKYIGRDYKVVSSKGHIRDLPQKELGIDIAGGFKPKYVIIRGKGQIVKKLKEATRNADTIYLAPDMDREGEAIAWHLKEALKLSDARVKRMTFNEITGPAILKALKNAGAIDMNKVNAQQARRLLDRIVGYQISPLLWRNVAKGLSAGRVQSVAVRLIVDREKEIQAFSPEKYWKITAALHPKGRPDDLFEALAEKQNGKKIRINDEQSANVIIGELKRENFVVAGVSEKERTEKAPPPFITSSLQQQASIQLNFSASKTMWIAQQLYEGVELGTEGSTGLITYMRTDSFHIADSALNELRAFIQENYGHNYLPEKQNIFRSRRGAQAAHEAIHPTSCRRTPESVRQFLTPEQFRLYELIWKRFVASQMKSAKYNFTNLKITNGAYLFRSVGRKMLFDGFTRVLGQDIKEQMLPEILEGETLDCKEIIPSEHLTQPPRRYTEATLVKALESKGIGRPSTYAPIIRTIQDRGYVRQQQRKFHATELGIVTTDVLVKYFPRILDVGFTSEMEEDLDKIEEARCQWLKVLSDFYNEFKPTIEAAAVEMRKEKKQAEISPFTCELCGKPMVYRFSKAGKFLGCSGFPKCKNSRPLEKNQKPVETNEVCEKCGKPMVRRTKGEAEFLACSAFPGCKNTRQLPKDEQPLEAARLCDKCGSPMVVKTSRHGRFLACSGYPACRNTEPLPTGVNCPREDCDGQLVRRRARGGRSFFGCSRYPRCDYTTNKLPAKA